MTSRSEVKAVLLSVEKRNGFICFLDMKPADLTRDELRVLIEAAKKAEYFQCIAAGSWRGGASDAEYIL